MRLYHFTSEHFGLEAIRDSRLKIARINELNDPFEFLGLALDKNGRKHLHNWKKTFGEQFGMISMSFVWQHPLLWGHYADKHKGLCLGFDVPDRGRFKKVSYVSQRPTLAQIGRNTLDELDGKDLQKLLFSKFEAWEYETEFRAFCRLDEKDPVNDHYYMKFSKVLKLAQVIVGERSTVTIERLQRVLAKKHKSVGFFRARAGFKRFEVVENLNKKVWLKNH